MNKQFKSGDVPVEGDLYAHDIITGIQQKFTVIFQQPFQPPADLIQLRNDYLTYLKDSYTYLDMKGISQVQQVTQGLPLTAVYVPLKTQSSGGGVDFIGHVVAGRMLHPKGGDMPDLSGKALSRQTSPQLIEEILKTEPAVVVLGDPGAGKSTLLKVTALALAELEAGPLPILLPLNAYALRLQKDEVNLCCYLGEYYASRRQNLKQVGKLFDEALKTGQAVILLDGIDEVQANRTSLVRLVQDFVGEYMPRPIEGDEPPPGNRIVVTSRIVGYENAPLAGEQWRTHRLIDFDREDIRRFVKQWSLLFAISVKSDTKVARQSGEQEEKALLEAIFSRPSVEKLAVNPLMLTILALVKYTGVTLPEQRVKLYEMYLQALIESWNRTRSLDNKPVGPGLNYEDTVQVLAPLALWLRQENPTAGLVSHTQLKSWLTDYYHGGEWELPKGEAKQRGREFLDSVEQYSNLLLERGEKQYGFLHLTLEEMLAAQGIAQLIDDDSEKAYDIIRQYLFEPGWHETLQLAVSFIGVHQRRQKIAGELLRFVLKLKQPEELEGRQVVFAGEALLDAGKSGISRVVAREITTALLDAMQSPTCTIRTRQEAGDLLGHLGWLPEADTSDFRPIMNGIELTGLDSFRPVLGKQGLWIGKYPVTNYQFARFIEDNGYDRQELWSAEGWSWRTGSYDSKAPDRLQNWLKGRPPEKRNQPYYWDDRKWNSPLYPVVGVSWFEVEAYANWLSVKLNPDYEVRLPLEEEWEAALGGRGTFPWGDKSDRSRLNCADAWAEQDFAGEDCDEWKKWRDDEEWKEAGLTAVTTYPRGVSKNGVWDGSGNIFEWMANDYASDGDTKALRGGCWYVEHQFARVSCRGFNPPVNFDYVKGFRVVAASV